MKINKNFWKKKKVFITGHTGFKGSWLSMILKYLGCEIYGYALSPSNSKSIFTEYQLDKIFKKSIISDVRNFKNLYKQINLIKPDIIIHLAAQSLVIDSYKSPRHTFDVNFMGTLNLIECIKKLNIKRTLVVTSDKVYKNNNKLKYFFDENDCLGGNDPYSASKASVEIMVNSYAKSFFKFTKKIYIATARAGNVVGGGDWSEKRLIPDFFSSLFKRKILSVRNPNHTRPWQHVMEPLIGYILLIQSMPFQSRKLNEDIAWNFGPLNKLNLSVKKILEILCTQNNKKIKINYSKNNFKLEESKNLSINTKKAKKFLNYQLKLNINDTLKLCTDWYNAYNKSIRSSHLVMRLQIANYLKKYYL